MNDLISIINDKPMADSRVVADKFGRLHKDVLKAINNLEVSDLFKERNFAHTPYIHPQNGREYSYYLMTRDGFTFLAMGFTGKAAAEWKEKYISAFNELERRAMPDFNDPAFLRQTLLGYADKVIELEKRVEKQQPAVEFVDRYVEAHDTKSIREVAKILHVGERWLATFLQDYFICFRQGVSLLPYAHHIKSDYFRVKTGEANGHAWHQTRFTPRGVEWISKKVNRVKWAV